MTMIEEPGAQAKLREFVMQGAYLHRRAFPSRNTPAFDPLERLSYKTNSMIADARGTDYEFHVYKFLTYAPGPQPNDLTAEFVRIMPRLTEDQRFIAQMYFNPLKLWRGGFTSLLPYLVKYGNEYLASTGFETLPYTALADQQFFERLHGKENVAKEIASRVTKTKDITPELLAELESTAPALVTGAL